MSPSPISEESMTLQDIQAGAGVPLVMPKLAVMASLISIPIVVQRPHRRFFLRWLTFPASANGREVTQSMRRINDDEKARAGLTWPLRTLLWTTSINIAKLSTFRHLDSEAQQHQMVEVIVSQQAPSVELTAAFHRPGLLHATIPFAQQYPSITSSSHSDVALLLGRKLDKRAIFWMLLAAVLLSLAAGLVVGLASARADIGIAVTGGLTGVISAVTGLLIWVLK